jgi:hypothetical protein
VAVCSLLVRAWNINEIRTRIDLIKVEEGVEIYELMMGEFEPAGDLCLYTIWKGAKEEGKTIKKQQWSE